MPDKQKKKPIFSRFRNLWDHKSDPASNTKGVVNDGECTLWLFPQALTLHAARSQDPQASAGIRHQEDGTLTVFRYLIDLTLSSRYFPG